MPLNTILIATNNPGKLLEFRSLMDELPSSIPGQLDILSLADLSISMDVAESMPTYDGNASAKARAYYDSALTILPPSRKLITLADDSGVEVEALGNAPGVRSHRFGSPPGGPYLDDAGRRAYLLQQLRGHPRPWKACFHCSLAVVHAGGLHITHGECRGTIIDSERGSNGFGYDPIFLLSKLDKTMAELNLSEKNRLSHRARAVKAALPLIARLLSSNSA